MFVQNIKNWSYTLLLLSQNIECLVTIHHRRLNHPEIWVGRSEGMVGTLDAGMSIEVSSSGRPRECSDSMELSPKQVKPISSCHHHHPDKRLL